MNFISRTMTGIVMLLLGFFLISIPFIWGFGEGWIAWIYGIPILIVSIFILLNEKEDKIEQIKNVKRGTKK